MKLGAITITFNEERFIDACINQFDGFDIDHLILISKKPWMGDFQMDKTWLKAKMHEAAGEYVTTVVDYWPDPATQLNFGLDLMWKTGHDWVLIVDTDEFYTPQDLGILIGEIRVSKSEAIFMPNMNVYWKTPEYKIIPRQKDNPIIAIRPGNNFHSIREVGDIKKNATMAEMHHMSYVRTDEQMWKKINSFYHAPEFDKKYWYEEVWSKWDENLEDLHPVSPSQFKRAIYDPSPPEIRQLFD